MGLAKSGRIDTPIVEVPHVFRLRVETSPHGLKIIFESYIYVGSYVYVFMLVMILYLFVMVYLQIQSFISIETSCYLEECWIHDLLIEWRRPYLKIRKIDSLNQ